MVNGCSGNTENKAPDGIRRAASTKINSATRNSVWTSSADGPPGGRGAECRRGLASSEVGLLFAALQTAGHSSASRFMSYSIPARSSATKFATARRSPACAIQCAEYVGFGRYPR